MPRDMNKKRRADRAYYLAHQEKIKRRSRRYHKKNWKKNYRKYRERYKWRRIQRVYKLSKQAYERMYRKQKGRCALCGRHRRVLRRGLFIDHNHRTGVVRGLLCISCNWALWVLGDSVKSIKRVLRYMLKGEPS